MVTKEQAEENPLEYLGKDIKMDEKGNIIIASNNDFSFSEFYDNLKQTIISRLKTVPGEYTIHPVYGSTLSTLLGMKFDQQTTNRMEIAVREAVFQEPRIQDVISLVVELDLEAFERLNETRVNISLSVQPINNLDPLNLIYSVFV